MYKPVDAFCLHCFESVNIFNDTFNEIKYFLIKIRLIWKRIYLPLTNSATSQLGFPLMQRMYMP